MDGLRIVFATGWGLMDGLRVLFATCWVFLYCMPGLVPAPMLFDVLSATCWGL